MPLDRKNGEVLDGLPASMHVVIDHRHLAAMNNLLVEYEAPGKFRAIKKHRPLFDDAMAIAQQRFAEAGALLPVVIDESGILVQVYPKENKVAVIVMRTIAGQERFVARDYDLPPSVIKSLLATTKQKHYEH
jgi:hypothetical protein